MSESSDESLQRVAPIEIRDARWVLIFKEATYEEGIYTVQETECTSILTFAGYIDAYKFSLNLPSELGQGTPTRWSADFISNFCELRDYEVIIVPYGHVPKIPQKNKSDFDGVHDYKNRFEALFTQNPENCTDDDCIP